MDVRHITSLDAHGKLGLSEIGPARKRVFSDDQEILAVSPALYPSLANLTVSLVANRSFEQGGSRRNATKPSGGQARQMGVVAAKSLTARRTPCSSAADQESALEW